MTSSARQRVHGRGDEVRGGGFLALQPGFKLVAHGQQFVDLRDDAVLFFSRWHWHEEIPQVAADPEQILDDAVHRFEALQMGG